MIKTKNFFFILWILLCGVLFQGFLQGEESPPSASIQQLTNKPHDSFVFSLSPENNPSLSIENKICLTMIVKNESHIIERCLNSVKDIVDYISICDTGSTDNTIEIIEQFMKKHQIPGKVHQHTWKNFGHNRTLSAKAAQETLRELNDPLTHTYLLLLDADMLLEIDPHFQKKALTADSYYILQQNDVMSYYNIRLIRASLPWECVGVTHEYWSCKFPKNERQFYHLKIDDRNDGGSKADKFERDVKLLTEGLQEEPNNERYMFYLAQSYKCLRQFDKAIEWYKARIAKGGWKEEVWYSKLMIGEMYEDMQLWDQALHWYLDAYQENPARAEPLHKIAAYYRIKGQHYLAYLFAKQGKSIPYPRDQILFISHPVYDYQLDEEISIAAYYIPAVKDEGFEAADRLAVKEGIPDYLKEQTYKNFLFYAKNLQNAQFQKIDLETSFINEEIDDLEFRLVLQPEILKDFLKQNPQPQESPVIKVKGIEDRRMFALDKPLEELESDRTDHHRIPFIKNNEIYLIYSYDPFTLYKLDSKTGDLSIAWSDHHTNYDFSYFRTSVAPIEFNNGYLMLIHEIVKTNPQSQNLHRFVYLDKDFQIQRMSRPFRFKHQGIEYCSAMTLDHSGKKLILPLNIDEKEAWICSIDVETVDSLLKPLP